MVCFRFENVTRYLPLAVLRALHVRQKAVSTPYQIALMDGAFFCYCAYVLRISGLVRNMRVLKEFAYQYKGICAVHGYAGKADLSEGHQNPNEHWG